jgi:hypothetical protein
MAAMDVSNINGLEDTPSPVQGRGQNLTGSAYPASLAASRVHVSEHAASVGILATRSETVLAETSAPEGEKCFGVQGSVLDHDAAAPISGSVSGSGECGSALSAPAPLPAAVLFLRAALDCRGFRVDYDRRRTWVTVSYGGRPLVELPVAHLPTSTAAYFAAQLPLLIEARERLGAGWAVQPVPDPAGLGRITFLLVPLSATGVAL